MKIFGNANETNKTIVLSLNSQLVEQSVTAAKTDGSVLTGGPLQDALATLSPTTSKLVVINVGAALQIAEQNSQFSSDEEAQKAKRSIDELIKASQKTTIRLLTNEAADSFGIRLSVSDLPPIRQLFGPISQLAQMISQSKAKVGHAQTKAQDAIGIPSASARRPSTGTWTMPGPPCLRIRSATSRIPPPIPRRTCRPISKRCTTARRCTSWWMSPTIAWSAIPPSPGWMTASRFSSMRPTASPTSTATGTTSSISIGMPAPRRWANPTTTRPTAFSTPSPAATRAIAWKPRCPGPRWTPRPPSARRSGSMSM